MSLTISRELWFVAPLAVEVRRAEVPALPSPGQVLVRALASGISQGSELLLYRGQGPVPFDSATDPPDRPVFPRRHEAAWVGAVIAAGAGSRHQPGDRVFALRPHGDYHLLADADARPLSQAVPDARAVLCASLETALTVIWDAGIALGDRVVVLGGGMIGLLCGCLAHRAGAAEVLLVEPSQRRREVARALAIARTATLEEDGPRGEADVVIEASGDPAALDRAVAHAGQEGTIVVASCYGTRSHPVLLGTDFHRRRLQLRASQSSSLPPSRTPRWDRERRFALVMSYLCDPSFDRLLDPPESLDRAMEVYARLDAAPAAGLQAWFRY